MHTHKSIFSYLIGLNSILLVLSILWAVNQVRQNQTSIQRLEQHEEVLTSVVPAASQNPSNTQVPTLRPSPRANILPSPTPSVTPPPSQNTSITPSATPTENIPSPSPSSSPIPLFIAASLRINAQPPVSLIVSLGKNQCELLQQAKDEGKLTQLSMQYNDSLHSYGVYQINSIGADNQVWWTYTVNGTRPPVGCSQLQVHDQDSVQWTYQGP